MEAAILLVLMVITGLQVANLISASRSRSLSSRAFQYRKSHDSRFARLVAVLRDRTEDLKHALQTCQTDNNNLTQLLHVRDAEVSRLTTLLMSIPFIQEQVKHLQLVLHEQVKEANSRVLALADARIQTQVEGQLLQRESISYHRTNGSTSVSTSPNISPDEAYREARRVLPLDAPEIDIRRRAQQIREENQQRDGFRSYPVDQVPVDTINNAPDPDLDYVPRRGESTVIRPPKLSEQHSEYPDAQAELAAAMERANLTPEKLASMVDELLLSPAASD